MVRESRVQEWRLPLTLKTTSTICGWKPGFSACLAGFICSLRKELFHQLLGSDGEIFLGKPRADDIAAAEHIAFEHCIRPIGIDTGAVILDLQ